MAARGQTRSENGKVTESPQRSVTESRRAVRGSKRELRSYNENRRVPQRVSQCHAARVPVSRGE